MGKALKEKKKELQLLISSRQKAVVSNEKNKSILRSYMTANEARDLCRTGQATMREVADYIQSRKNLEQSIEIMTDAIKIADVQIKQKRNEISKLEQKEREKRMRILKLMAPVWILGFEKLCRWMETWGWSISQVVYDVAFFLFFSTLFADGVFFVEWLQRKFKH